MLNLNDALVLYNILGEYLPDEFDGDIIKYSRETIKNIGKGENSEDYIDSILVMNNSSFEELVDKSPSELFELFVRGLVSVDMYSLKSFCEQLNYGRSSN